LSRQMVSPFNFIARRDLPHFDQRDDRLRVN
jgi:hypothetical protein